MIVLENPRVLHVLANSAPDVNGYAIRSHDLLVSLSEAKICQPIVLTSPFYPHKESMKKAVTVDGILYDRSVSKKAHLNIKKKHGFNVSKDVPFLIRAVRFLFYKSKLLFKQLFSPFLNRVVLFRRFLGEKKLMRKFEKDIILHAQKHKPNIIHAHTPFRVGLPALRAARKLGLPFVYEVRGMWEDSAVAQGRWKTSSIQYRYYRNQENKLIKKADEVIAIGTNLGKEVTGRNLRQTPLTIVPNAVGRRIASEPMKPKAVPLNAQNLLQRLKLESSTLVVGYIGSLRALEGVDYTAEAVAHCVKQGLDLRFLVCSSKANQDKLKQYCTELMIDGISFIEGPYPHDEIVHFYDLIDIFVVSRPNTNVTRIVPPIKPLEAMVRMKPTVVSELPALCEIIENHATGITFPAEDVSGLSDVISKLAANPSMMQRIGTSARDFVLEKRTWPEIVHNYDEVYQRVITEVSHK